MGKSAAAGTLGNRVSRLHLLLCSSLHLISSINLLFIQPQTAVMACKHSTGLLSKCSILVKRPVPAYAQVLLPSRLAGARHASSNSRYNRSQADEERTEEARAMERNFTRDWKVGDVYAPHDLSAAEARKWRMKKAPSQDAFDVLSINPLDVYKVGSLDSIHRRL